MSKLNDILGKYSGQIHESIGVRAKDVGTRAITNVKAIELDRIQADPDQPRKTFDEAELLELAATLKRQGQLQPAVVRYDQAADKFVIIAGERRWRAARLAGLATLNCIVDDGVRDEDAWHELAIVENVQREDLKPVEQARFYKRMMDARGWTQKQVAEAIGLNEAKICRVMRLLDLPEDLQGKVDAGELSATAAYVNTKKATTKKPGAKKAKPFARVIRTSCGITIELKAKKQASIEDQAAAMREALALIELQSKAA